MSLSLSLSLFLSLVRQLLYEHSGRSPSLRVAVAAVCALRALRLPARTARIAYYADAAEPQVPDPSFTRKEKTHDGPGARAAARAPDGPPSLSH